jgi:hypothetical protein
MKVAPAMQKYAGGEQVSGQLERRKDECQPPISKADTQAMAIRWIVLRAVLRA